MYIKTRKKSFAFHKEGFLKTIWYIDSLSSTFEKPLQHHSENLRKL